MKLSPGQASDHTYAPYLAARAAEAGVAAVVGDKGYDSDSLYKLLASLGIEPVIPTRGNKLARPSFSRALYRERNLVERFIGRIKGNRRAATRFDKKASHYQAFVVLAAIKNHLKLFVSKA